MYSPDRPRHFWRLEAKKWAQNLQARYFRDPHSYCYELCYLSLHVTYLILLKTMSTSVTVTFFPSITWQSLHSFDQFLPCISFPVALVSPCTANRRKASSRALSSGAAAAPSFAPSDSSDSLLAALSLAGSPGDLGGVLLADLAGLALLSAMLLGKKKKRVILLLTAHLCPWF